MKKLPIIILLGICIAIMSACNKTRTIPDEKLANILKEIYLVNAYSTSNRGFRLDSVDMYTPILEKYGYTPDDLKNTLEHFSRRKSSRLSDVVNQAITDIDREYNYYYGRVAVADTLKNRAAEKFKQLVYSDTLIKVTHLRDTSKLRVKIPVHEGTYKIQYSYLIDTTDFNNALQTNHNVRDSLGRNLFSRTNWMTRIARTHYETDMEVPANGRNINIYFGGYGKTASEPNIRIDTLAIYRYLPEKVALDSLNRSDSLYQYSLKIAGKPYPDYYAKDSIPLRITSVRDNAPADSIP